MSDGSFATIHKIKVGHMLAAHNSENDFQAAVKLIMNSVKIDDKVPTAIDVLNLEMQDFHKIMEALNKK